LTVAFHATERGKEVKRSESENWPDTVTIGLIVVVVVPTTGVEVPGVAAIVLRSRPIVIRA
jgi:hypothetical protein